MTATTVSGGALLALASVTPLAASYGNDAGVDTVGGQGDTDSVTLVTEAPAAVGDLDGVYESVRGPGDSVEGCDVEFAEQTLRLDVGGGEYTLSFDGVPGNVGQVEVVEDHVTFTGEISARWSIDGTTLTLSEIEGADGLPAACDVAMVWGAQPWDVVDAASAEAPAAVGDLDGVYESVRGPGDSVEGCDVEFAEQTLRLDVGGGEYTLSFDGVPGNVGQVEVVEDHVTFTGEISARWSIDGTTLTLSEIEGADGLPAACDVAMVWGAQPWDVVDAASAEAPAAVGDLDGVYESVRGPGDSVEGCDVEFAEQTLRLDVGGGEYTLSFDGVPGNVGQVEVVEDHVTFTGEISARWSIDGTTLTLSEIEGADGLPAACDVAMVWGAQPWDVVESG